MSLTKKTYLQGFVVAVLILACLRWAFPGIAAPVSPSEPGVFVDTVLTAAVASDSVAEMTKPATKGKKHHRILSVPSYTATFPDTNAVQLVAAQKWGVTPVKNREDAESRKRELVYIGSNPYFHVDPLYSSIPYLVPRAAVLLQDIGQAFLGHRPGVLRQSLREGCALPQADCHQRAPFSGRCGEAASP